MIGWPAFRSSGRTATGRAPTSKERGQGAVEFALTIPILFALVIGVIELGVAFNAYVTVTNAAREGARAGAIYLYDSSPAYNQALNDQNREGGTGTATPYPNNVRDTAAGSLAMLKDYAGFDKNADITITYTPNPTDLLTRRGHTINVEVRYRHVLMTNVLGPTVITMKSQGSARIE